MKLGLTLSIGLLLALAACKTPKPDPQASEQAAGAEHAQAAHSSHAHHDDLKVAQATELSLYQLENSWQTHSGKTIKLAEFSGKPVLLAMVYASCKNACPRIIADMQRIQADVSKAHPNLANFVLVSIDPEVDTPARLAQLAQKSHLNAQWQLLRGDSNSVMELAALLGVQYRKISDKDYAHSNLITVLNAKGEIVHRQEGLGVDPAQTVQVLNQLMS